MSQSGFVSKRRRVSSMYARGSTPLRRHVEKIESIIDACSPASSLPKKYQFLRPVANLFISCSARLLSTAVKYTR